VKDASAQGDQKNKGSQHPDDDEGESTVGVNPDVYPDPEGRKQQKGTIDAPWGERDTTDGNNDPEHYSDAAYQQFIEGRQEMLDKLFASKGPAAKAEQALVGQQLQHGASGAYESRAPLLEPEAVDPVKEAESAFFDGIVD
jgi:hypothetical protein